MILYTKVSIAECVKRLQAVTQDGSRGFSLSELSNETGSSVIGDSPKEDWPVRWSLRRLSRHSFVPTFVGRVSLYGDRTRLTGYFRDHPFVMGSFTIWAVCMMVSIFRYSRVWNRLITRESDDALLWLLGMTVWGLGIFVIRLYLERDTQKHMMAFFEEILQTHPETYGHP